MEAAVKKILLSEDGGVAKGVELEDGTRLEADVVVNNSDLVYAYENLLPVKTPYAESLKGRPGSCSSISFYWALNRQVPELEAHNIFLADEYRESFDSIFKKHLIPDEPSFYVNVPSRVDPTAAPEGKDSVVVLVPVGHLLEEDRHASQTQQLPPSHNGTIPNSNSPISTASPPDQPGLIPTEEPQNWPAMISLARKTILSTIHSRTNIDLTPLILHETTNSPLTWKTTFNLDRGAILGLSHSFFNVLCFRPTTRARKPGPLDAQLLNLGVLGRVAEVVIDALFRANQKKDIRGLYMVGASAHPGTGVPICLAGGKLVAEQICGDEGMEIPWREQGKGDGARREKRRLDVLEKPMWRDSWEQWVKVLVCLFMVVLALLMLMKVR
ncbi:hypothetical protein BST61_g2837 [Cercospora zeina]